MRMRLEHDIYVHFFRCYEFSNSHVKLLYLFELMIALTDHSSLIARKLMEGIAVAFPHWFSSNGLTFVVYVVYGWWIQVSFLLVVSKEHWWSAQVVAVYHVILIKTEWKLGLFHSKSVTIVYQISSKMVLLLNVAHWYDRNYHEDSLADLPYMSCPNLHLLSKVVKAQTGKNWFKRNAILI